MNRQLRSNLLLMLTAAIWGFAFVAQRAGMAFIGPFAFNAARFMLGATVLLPLIWHTDRRRRSQRRPVESFANRRLLMSSAAGGVLLFFGASFQQAGLVYTSAGKAGFITGLYVVFVPLMGLAWGQRTGAATWVGAFLATVGLYLLSVTSELTIAFGDILILISAVVWAGHVQLIAWASPKIDALKLAVLQFYICAGLSLLTALFLETASVTDLRAAWLPILYAGLLSVGVGYTVQVFAQRGAHPAHAALIMSLEAVFAVVGGVLILSETLDLRAWVGCLLMFCGMLLSQLAPVEQVALIEEASASA